MNKMILAIILAAVSAQVAYAGVFFNRGNRNGNCCGRVRNCAPACAAPCVEPEPPICFKTVQVPKTIMVNRKVQVPARKIVCPQPAVCERIPQPCKTMRIPQPPIQVEDKVVQIPVADKVVYHKQPDIVRYECPSDACAVNCGC